MIDENPYPRAPLTMAAKSVMRASATVWADMRTYHMILVMQTRERLSEVVEAEGHLIDSQLLNVVFDTVIKGNASFEVLRFTIGRTNEEPSFIAMRITGPDEPGLQRVLEALVTLGCRIASSHDAAVRQRRQGWMRAQRLLLHDQPADIRPSRRQVARGRSSANGCGHRDRRRRAECRKFRDVRTGDMVVCGVEGIRVTPEFRERDRLGFAFMTNEISSERRVEAGVARIAEMIGDIKRSGGRIAVVAGPVVVHTGGVPYFCELISAGFVDVLLAGNALAVHDVENALFGTSLGVDSRPAGRSRAATAITCGPSTPSAALAAFARPSSRASSRRA